MAAFHSGYGEHPTSDIRQGMEQECSYAIPPKDWGDHDGVTNFMTSAEAQERQNYIEATTQQGGEYRKELYNESKGFYYGIPGNDNFLPRYL